MTIRLLACVIALLTTAPGVWPAAAAARAVSTTVSKATRHLTFTARLTPDVVTPGTRILLVVDVTPKKRMHVYAPGTKYRAVAIALERHPALKVHDTVYPPPTPFHFKPLDETVLVYERPFRLTADIMAGDTPAQQAVLKGQSRLAIKGELTYQACDDTVCYLPASVPFAWSVTIAR